MQPNPPESSKEASQVRPQYAERMAIWAKQRQNRGLKERFYERCFRLPRIRLRSLVPESFHLPVLITDGRNLPTTSVWGHDDLEPVLQLTMALRAKVAIEFGTAYGNTAANLCLAGVERVITVNALPEQTSGVIRTFDLTENEIGWVYRKHGYKQQVTQLLCNTLDVNLRESIPESSADIAIVDACHDYDFVIHDFLKVAPFIRPGGIVLLHDTEPTEWEHLGSSYWACMHLRRSGYDIRHLEGTWWGIWQRPEGKMTTSPVRLAFASWRG